MTTPTSIATVVLHVYYDVEYADDSALARAETDLTEELCAQLQNVTLATRGYAATFNDVTYNTTILDNDTEDEPPDPMTDAEADADVLRSAGMGTDEDYGYYPWGEEV